MPCLRAGRANNHAQSGSELYAILPISKRTFSYRTRPGSRHGPGQGIAGRQELLGRRDPAVVAHAHLGVGERRPVRQTFGHPCRSTPQWGQEARGTSRGASLPVTTTSRKSLDTVGEVARLSGSRAARRRQAHAERCRMQAFSGLLPTSPTVSHCFSWAPALPLVGVDAGGRRVVGRGRQWRLSTSREASRHVTWTKLEGSRWSW